MSHVDFKNGPVALSNLRVKGPTHGLTQGTGGGPRMSETPPELPNIRQLYIKNYYRPKI